MGVLRRDTFGAAAGPLDSTWTQQRTAGTVNYDGSGNAAAQDTLGQNPYAFDNSNLYSANQYVKATIGGGITGSGTDFVIILTRASLSGDANYKNYYFKTDGASGAGHSELGRITADISTVLLNVVATFAAGDVIELRSIGTKHEVFKNGVSVGSVLDSTHTAGAPGLGFDDQAGGTTPLLADWEGGFIDVPAPQLVQPKGSPQFAGILKNVRIANYVVPTLVASTVPPSVAPLYPETRVYPKKRRRRVLSAEILRSPQQRPATSRAPTDPLLQVQPKKRKRRAGSGKLLRAPVQRSFAPDKPQLVVAGRKRRKRSAPDTLLITGARRSPTKPPKTLTQVTPKRKRRRTGDTLLVTGARRATPAPSVRPIRPIKVVATKKRRQKLKPAQLLKPARGAPPAAAQRPIKPLTQVKAPKRRRRPGDSTLVTGARRAAAVAAPARRSTLTVAPPKKRRKRTADATIITGARRAAAALTKKRSPIAIVQPKRKRRAKPQTQRLSTRGRGGAAALARAILKSVGTIALGPSRTSSIAGYTVDRKTIALSAAKSKSVSLRASQSGTIVLKPLNTAKPMSTFNSSIVSVVAGDDLDVVRTVTAIPATQTLAKAWLTFKSKLTDTDVQALLQKVILPGAVAGQGQITDTGASGTGSLLFQLSQADTLALPIGVNTLYDIKVLTSAGKIYTAEQGMYLAAKRVTISTS